MRVHLKLEHEPWPGERWQRFFVPAWPLYRRWYESEGEAHRPDLVTCQSVLELHMPELVPVYRALCRLADDDAMASRFLSMWCPPPYLAGCSQVAWTRGNPTLIRNYDFAPSTFDGRLRYSEYCKPVIGMQDSAWGLLDGMNGDGLAAALAFGGRRAIGQGFGIPLVIRYILETCSTVADACAVLARVPVHMGYSVTLIDKSRAHATVFVNPDRPIDVVDDAATTNHQHQVEWDDYAALTHTVERQLALQQYLADPAMTRRKLMAHFLKAPLFSQQYFRSFGTLYTAAYDVARRQVRLAWPTKQVQASFRTFEEQTVDVILLRPAGVDLVGGGGERHGRQARRRSHSSSDRPRQPSKDRPQCQHPHQTPPQPHTCSHPPTTSVANG